LQLSDLRLCAREFVVALLRLPARSVPPELSPVLISSSTVEDPPR
jgi:hypothetical protein